MKKRYIFLIFTLSVGAAIVFFGKTDRYNPEIDKLEQDIEDIRHEGDSTIDLAEDVINNFVEQKKLNSEKIESFENLVEEQDMTIEEQLVKLRKALKEANEFKQMAEDQSKLALEMKEMAQKQKEMAELAKMEAQEQLNMVLLENKRLKEKLDSLLNPPLMLDYTNTIFVDSTSINTVDESEKKKKKRKKNN
jgi:hypothetical protein